MTSKLAALGFSPFFHQQVSQSEIDNDRLARIVEVQRTKVIVSNGVQTSTLSLGGGWFQLNTEDRPTIGDWVVVDGEQQKIARLLNRTSVFKRLAVGKKVDIQLIAANVDTLFIVTSCNEDFSEARLERYLAMASEANVTPVVIITKSDLASNAANYRERILALKPDIPVELVNALSTDSFRSLTKWTTQGATIALVGSSGVGKSTIVNLLCQKQVARTADIRAQDAKGRHTTSYRSLHKLPSGGLLLDLPGMREVKVAESDRAVSEVFSDIDELAEKCRFADCAHLDEPDCAVISAIDNGSLDERRLSNYHKLRREESSQTSNLAKQRHRNKHQGKSTRQQALSKHERKNKKDK